MFSCSQCIKRRSTSCCLLGSATCPKFAWFPASSGWVSSFVQSLCFPSEWIIQVPTVYSFKQHLFFSFKYFGRTHSERFGTLPCVSVCAANEVSLPFSRDSDVAATPLLYLALSRNAWTCEDWAGFSYLMPSSDFQQLVSFLWLPAASSYFIFMLWVSLQAVSKRNKNTKLPHY